MDMLLHASLIWLLGSVGGSAEAGLFEGDSVEIEPELGDVARGRRQFPRRASLFLRRHLLLLRRVRHGQHPNRRRILSHGHCLPQAGASRSEEG